MTTPVTCSTAVLFLEIDYNYYSQYGPEAYYAHFVYGMPPYYKGFYEELQDPQAQEQSYGEG